MKTTSPSKRRSRTAKTGSASTISPVENSAGDVVEMVPQLLRIRHILVPLDFSDTAEKALRYAVSFARQFDAKIMLVHVRPNHYYPAGAGEFSTAIPADEPPLDQLKARLDEDARRLVPAKMCERTALRAGVASDEICAVAQEFSVDLIIIATHGRTGLKRAILGSTTERVVRHAPCPVLVVREHEQEFA